MPAEIEGALVVHVVLEIQNEDVHRTHFHVRDTSTGGVRAMDKYLDQLDEIRAIQGYIVERAEKHGVPVIESSNPERATDCGDRARARLGRAGWRPSPHA